MKYLAVLQARMQSSRLPHKVLKDLCGMPVLGHIVQRARRSKKLDGLVVATSTHPADDPVATFCRQTGISCFRGSEDDVLSRFAGALRAANGYSKEDCVVRLTADDPFKDPLVIDEAIQYMASGRYDYVSNTLQPTFPEGIDVEVVRAYALLEADREAQLTSEREHVTPFIWKQPERFALYNFLYNQDLSSMRWTLDTPDDWTFVEAVYKALYPQSPAFTMEDVLQLLENRPDIAHLMNRQVQRNAGYALSIKKEEQPDGREADF